jgi:16S rRNA (uracil1498-N3)-methyltransferase
MLPYFYHKDLATTATSFSLTEEASKHCVQVLRKQEGDQLQLTNGKGLSAIVEIVTPHKKNTLVKIKSHQQHKTPYQKNTIAISLVKNASRFEWFLEKATELGIYEIVPLICKRTERQLFKAERLQSILISAMLQSQQCWLPLMETPIPFNEFVKNNTTVQKFIAHCIDVEKKELKTTVNDLLSKVILIGPEGDFTPEEIELAITNNFIPVALGSTRLRTETAGIVAATILQLA